ncbi:hypothetical protein ACJX0J_042586, partial [Zea mays]
PSAVKLPAPPSSPPVASSFSLLHGAPKLPLLSPADARSMSRAPVPRCPAPSLVRAFFPVAPWSSSSSFLQTPWSSLQFFSITSCPGAPARFFPARCPTPASRPSSALPVRRQKLPAE